MVIRIKRTAVLAAFLAAVCALFCISGLPHTERAAASSVSAQLPVIMYHQISRSKSEKYIIRSDELESDLKYLAARGYKTVTVQDIINFVEHKMPLPEKSVMLTFDDGQETVYTLLYPLLKKYDMKAVAAVIGSLADLYTENEDHNDRYSYMSWDEIKELSMSGRVEIQNHSYNMHFFEESKRKGISPLKNESYDAYYKALYDDLSKNQLKILNKTGTPPTAVMYPYGFYGENTAEVCRRIGFEATFTCEERINTLTYGRPQSLFNLGRFNRHGGVSSERFFKNILE